MTEVRFQLDLFDFNVFITILLNTHIQSITGEIYHLPPCGISDPNRILVGKDYPDFLKDSQLDLILSDYRMFSLKYGTVAVKGKEKKKNFHWRNN